MPSYASRLQDFLDDANKRIATLESQRDRLAEFLSRCMEQGLSHSEAEQAQHLLRQIER